MLTSTIIDNNNIEPTCAGSSQNINPSSIGFRQTAENSAINFMSVFTVPEDCFISKCDLKTLLSLRKVSKGIYNNIPINKLFNQFSIEHPRYSKNGFSYQAYNNTIGPWLEIVAPEYKNKIDKYISAFPKNKFNAKFSEYLFFQINILQQTADLSILEKYNFPTEDITRYPLPDNILNTALSDCGQYLIVLNKNNEIIISLITAKGLQQINKINDYRYNLNTNITSSGNNIILSVSNLEVHILKLNPIECNFNSKNITIYKPYSENYDGTCMKALLSRDENFLFTLDPKKSKFKIGSIENNNYNTITEIDNVNIFKLSSNNKTLVILTINMDVLFYCRKNISKHWELEKSFIYQGSLYDGINIHINDNADLCVIKSHRSRLTIFKIINAKWELTFTSKDCSYAILLPALIANDKILCGIKTGINKIEYIHTNLSWFTKNIEKPKKLLPNTYSVKDNYEDSDVIYMHPSKLAFFKVSLQNNNMQIFISRKKTLMLAIKHFKLSAFLENNIGIPLHVILIVLSVAIFTLYRLFIETPTNK